MPHQIIIAERLASAWFLFLRKEAEINTRFLASRCFSQIIPIFTSQKKRIATNYKQLLQQLARDLGFLHLGVAKAEFMDTEARRLENWLHQGYHGQMQWMENHFDKRVDPTQLVTGAKTVVSLLYNYFPADENPSKTVPKIARYAYGEDYHHVIKSKLRSLMQGLEAAVGAPINGRAFVDSAPVLERDWAKRAGNGWVGKHTLLINPKAGSYFFLAELIIDLELPPDGPMKDYCGTCTRCIDACPTEAISPQGYLLDASKCISYLTIELKEAIPDDFNDKMEGWAFGCDICQEVCPWNRFSKPHQEPAFDPNKAWENTPKTEWLEMSEEVFRKVFQKSPVKRTKYSGWKRNVAFLKKQNP